jgi:predicted NACHT family NTPase
MALGLKVLDKILEDIYENIIKAGGATLERKTAALDLFHKGRKKYFDTLRNQHGFIRILGMSTPMAVDQLYIPVRISKELSGRKYLDKQYIDFINKQQKFPSAISQELTRIFQSEKQDAIKVIEDGQYFILVGGPGSGKTTLMRYLTLMYSGRIEPKHSKKLALFPVLITLRDNIDKNKSLINLMVEQLKLAELPEPKLFLERLLERGKCILLLDGLDEIPSERQRTIADKLSTFSSKYPENRVIISTRISDPLAKLENFTEVEICEFGEKEILKFVNSWFKQEKQDKGRELSNRISKDINLKELATTPLLLSLICILYKNDLRIPTNRSELYERCVECLLREWDTNRGFRRETLFERFSDSRKIQFFSYFAHEFFINNHIFFKYENIAKHLTRFLSGLAIEEDSTKDVLNELIAHHGIFVKKAPKIYSFSHLTFQEFFSAKYLVSVNKHYIPSEYIKDPKWKEVVTLIACMLPDATDFLTYLLHHIDTTKLKRLASRGTLGYECVLLKSLVLSEINCSTAVRNQLYKLYLQQHTQVYPVPWDILFFDWRYSPKAAKVMIKLNFNHSKKKKLQLTDAVTSFRYTLDTISLAQPLLKYYAENFAPEDNKNNNSFTDFTKMSSDIFTHGGAYAVKINI